MNKHCCDYVIDTYLKVVTGSLFFRNMEAESSKMATARPSRARKKLKIEIKYDEDPAPVEPKIRKPQRKGNTGKLAGLIDLPLDVLFEVSHFFSFSLLSIHSSRRVRYSVP